VQIGGLPSHSTSPSSSFRIVPSIESPLPPPYFAIDVTIGVFSFAHDQDLGFNSFWVESSGLSEKFPNQKFMILYEHRRYYIPFRRKIEERKVAFHSASPTGHYR